MVNYFFNSLQLNTGNVKCSLLSYNIAKSFNNNRTVQYDKSKVLMFPISANADDYIFEIMLYIKNIGTYLELLDKEEEIKNALDNHVTNHETVAFSSDTTPVWFDEIGDVHLLFETSDYRSRATDGKSFITLKFEAKVQDVI